MGMAIEEDREAKVSGSPHNEEQPNMWEEELHANMESFDDLTSKELDNKMAGEARELQMQGFGQMNVYAKVRRSEVLANRFKVIITKWLAIFEMSEPASSDL